MRIQGDYLRKLDFTALLYCVDISIDMQVGKGVFGGFVEHLYA